MLTAQPQDYLEQRLTFPPFPPVPEGVTIVPFSKFKERGIQIFATGDDDDVELDGLGIPTVELRAQHGTDVCKTETKRKRRAKKAQQILASAVTPAARKEWWEQWMVGEDLRVSSDAYNPNTSPIDRLYEAAADFRKSRTWPPAPTGIAAVWDQIRLFIGLLSNMPIWTRTDKPAQDNDSASDNDDDDLGSDVEAVHEAGTNLLAADQPHPRKYHSSPRARPPYAMYGASPIPVGSNAEVKDLLDEENVRKEEKVVTFLNDPEEQLKIFLSSYMRKQGLIWADRNLVNYPRLIGFFLRFLIRNRVFPEASHERDLRRALVIVDLAQKELILTSKLAKKLPDRFHLACTACWGTKAVGYRRLQPVDPPRESTNISEEGEARGEPDAKKVKLDINDPDPSVAADTAVEKFEEELKAQNVQVIKNDVLIDLPYIGTNEDSEPASTWTWDEDSCDPSAFAPGGNTDPWAASTSNWDPPEVHSLIPLLGFTAFPLTHTPGVVEWSVRRIKSFTPPPVPTMLPKSPVQTDIDPEAVEVELERRFAKVVFEPWIGWDQAQDEMPHLAKPRILESSRGPVVGGENAEAAPAPVPADGPKPHDPLKDDITVLVEPAMLEYLSLGMGLGATWVQIAREDFAEDGAKKKKKKKGKSKVADRYWYIDELLMTLPSYHT